MKPLVNEKIAADILGCSVLSLRTWRSTKRVNLPYCKIGKSVRYTVEDLEAYVAKNRVGGDS
jgi:hypothetical protein